MDLCWASVLDLETGYDMIIWIMDLVGTNRMKILVGQRSFVAEVFVSIARAAQPKHVVLNCFFRGGMVIWMANDG